MNPYSHNIASDIVKDYKNIDTTLIKVEKKFYKNTQTSLSDYIFYDHIKKELATTMLNTAYREDIMDTNPYHNQIGELYEHLDEKLEIIDAYMTEYALKNEIAPGVYKPKMEKALLYVEQTKTFIHGFIQNFKISASKIENEEQRENILPIYQQIMTILSNYIGQIEEYFS